MTTREYQMQRNTLDKIRILRYHSWKYLADPRRRHPVSQIGFRSDVAGKLNDGPSQETLRLWLLRSQIPKVESLQAMCDFINKTLVCKSTLTLDLLSDDVSTQDFYSALGIDVETTQDNDFSQWAQDVMLCRSFTFDSFLDAEQFGRYLPGRYQLLRQPLEATELRIETLALTVHKAVHASSRQTERRMFFPCQLTIRSTKKSNTLFWYKGAVGALDDGVEWRFFQEGTKNRDRIEIMTSKGGPQHDLDFEGWLLTLSEAPSYAPVATKMKISKVGELMGWESDREFLTSTPMPNRPFF
jgi:hypothetical protein